MDDSPRSSKRRKLDTPARNSSLQVPRITRRTPSGRTPQRAVSLTNGSSADAAEETFTPTRQSSRKLARTPNGLTNGRLRGGATEDADVYDDIEGALSQKKESPVPSSALKKPGSIRKRKPVVWDPAVPHPFKKSPSKPKPIVQEDDTNGIRSASRSSFRSLVNGFKHGDEAEAGAQDELAADPPTPSRKGKGAATTNGTPNGSRSVAKTRSSGRKTQSSAVDTLEESSSDQLQSIAYDGATASKGRGRKKNIETQESPTKLSTTKSPGLATPSRRITARTVIPESEDELGDREPPSRTRSARDRRRANRADHTANRDDGGGLDIITQADAVSGAVPEEDEDEADVDGNSALGSVLDPTEPSPFNKPSPALKKQDVSAVLQDDIGEGRELDLLKTIVMERITGKRAPPLIGLDDELKSVTQLVENTITAGEGNSMLVIGARGSGKTALVNRVLGEVAKDNSEDFHVVRLNGFIHTDDKITLKEIWRQLGKEMDVEEDGGVGKNYADTLTTLLALLSHPSEHTGEATEHVAKAVVFVMDEFDLFASHPRQTLLYNLFDIAQSRKAPIAVLGLTTRIDVVNSLEKRVKSRFSHRYVHLSLAKTFTTFQEICKASLLVQPEQLSVEERAILTSPPPTTTPSRGRKSKESTQATAQGALTAWNNNITALFGSQSFLLDHLAPHFYRTKSISAVLTTFLHPTSTLSTTTPLLSSYAATSLNPSDSKLTLLPSLSTLSLSLLIAAARLDIIHDSDTCNFNMCYDEYVTLASKARIQAAAGGASASGSVSKVWGKEIARREWEGLVELGLVIPVISGRAGGFDMVRADVALEEIGVVIAGDKGVERALERWCKQI